MTPLLYISFVIWTLAGFLSLLIIHVDIDTVKQHPVSSFLLLMYLGPSGWVLGFVRCVQVFWSRV